MVRAPATGKETRSIAAASIGKEDLSSLVLEIAAWGSQTEQLLWFSAPLKARSQAAVEKFNCGASRRQAAFNRALGKKRLGLGEPNLVAATLIRAYGEPQQRVRYSLNTGSSVG